MKELEIWLSLPIQSLRRLEVRHEAVEPGRGISEESRVKAAAEDPLFIT